MSPRKLQPGSMYAVGSCANDSSKSSPQEHRGGIYHSYCPFLLSDVCSAHLCLSEPKHLQQETLPRMFLQSQGFLQKEAGAGKVQGAVILISVTAVLFHLNRLTHRGRVGSPFFACNKACAPFPILFCGFRGRVEGTISGEVVPRFCAQFFLFFLQVARECWGPRRLYAKSPEKKVIVPCIYIYIHVR